MAVCTTTPLLPTPYPLPHPSTYTHTHPTRNPLPPLSGHLLPSPGLGVYRSASGGECYQAVLSALRLGYRHIDTAQIYGNEADVGRWVARTVCPPCLLCLLCLHRASSLRTLARAFAESAPQV